MAGCGEGLEQDALQHDVLRLHQGSGRLGRLIQHTLTSTSNQQRGVRVSWRLPFLDPSLSHRCSACCGRAAGGCTVTVVTVVPMSLPQMRLTERIQASDLHHIATFDAVSSPRSCGSDNSDHPTEATRISDTCNHTDPRHDDRHVCPCMCVYV